MKSFLQFAAAVFLLAAALSIVSVADRLMNLCDQTTQTELAAQTAIGKLPALVDAHAKRIEKQIDAAVSKADIRLQGIQNVADEQLGAANRSIGMVATLAATELPALQGSLSDSLAKVTEDVHETLEPVSLLMKQANDAAPMFLDCSQDGGGQDCIFNRFQGTSKAIERTMQAIAKATPEVSGNVSAISTDVRREVDAIVKPRHWWQKLGALLGLGATVGARVF